MILNALLNNNILEITDGHTIWRDKDNIKEYFKNKWKNIPYVEKYIDLLLKYDIPSRTIDSCLGYIAYNLDPIFMATRVGVDIAKQIYELRNETPYKYGKHVKEVK